MNLFLPYLSVKSIRGPLNECLKLTFSVQGMLKEGLRVISSIIDIKTITNYCLYSVNLKYKIYFVNLVWIEIRISLHMDVGIILCLRV